MCCTVPATSSTKLLKLKEELKGISDEVHEQLFPESLVESLCKNEILSVKISQILKLGKIKLLEKNVV